MPNNVKQILKSPSLRGGLFYASLWGVFGTFSPFMNLELSRRGFTGLQIGSIGSIRAAVILVMAMVWSRIADRNGIRVKMLRWVITMSGVGVMLFSFPRSFPFLVAAIVFLAIWQAPVDSLGNSILVRMSKKHNVDYGMMTFWGAVAYAITNLVGGWIWEKIGFNWIYIAAGVGYILVSFIVTTLEEPEKESPSIQEIRKENTSGKPAFKPILIVFLAAYFVFSLAFFNAFGFTANILDMRGASEFVIGLVGTLIGIGGMFVRRGNRAILSRISLPMAMIIGISMGLVPIFVYGWVDNIPLILAASVFRGAGWGMFSLCSVRFIDAQASVENASTLQSSLIMLTTLSNIISSTLAGYLFDTNPTLIFTISAIAAFVSLGILLVVQWLNRRESESIGVEMVN